MILRRFFPRIHKSTKPNDPVMQSIEDFLRMKQDQGEDLNELRKRTISDADLAKLEKALKNGDEVDMRSININIPPEMSIRIEAALEKLPDVKNDAALDLKKGYRGNNLKK